jgi:citrate synthase
VEVAYLLVHGSLPTEAQRIHFSQLLGRYALIHEDMIHFFDGFPHHAHPMAILSSATNAISTFYEEFHDPTDEDSFNESALRLIAKMPTIAAWAYKKSTGMPYCYPRNDLAYVENFIHMMFHLPVAQEEVDPVLVKALNVLLILHADHEQNCSTATVRGVGSSQANLFASVSAGIGALWGPLHGGANQRVIEMLRTIVDDPNASAKSMIARAKDPNDPFRLMGFGHRVYKNYDPRATIIKETADAVFEVTGKNPMLDIALKLEETALADDYFVDRKLYPNVDFYSGMIFRALGFPVRMFTVLFAIGRLPGWMAQWEEMSEDPDTRIMRPRQIYVGEINKEFVPINER